MAIVNVIKDMFLYYWKLEFFWTMEDQDKNQKYYLVMIFSVLCLLDVLHFIISLSEGNLFEDWEAATTLL